MIIKVDNTESVAKLFENTTDTVIISCLQKVMGDIYATKDLKSAVAVLGDFSFFVGEPCKELVMHLFETVGKKFSIMVPEGEAWKALYEALDIEAKKITRYGLKKEYDRLEAFDKSKLQANVDALSEEYKIVFIDEAMYERCKVSDWCYDWVYNYPTYELYKKHGLGVCILKDDMIVAGASSYSGFNEGIEIEIDTHVDYRKQGLARVCASKLILTCLERGLYPSWDAANTISLHLATSLGYTSSGEYDAYLVDLRNI